MRTLRLNDFGPDVLFLKALLRSSGFDTDNDAHIHSATKDVLIAFQKKHGLEADAIVGRGTWRKLFEEGYSFYPVAANQFLTSKEYVSELHYKKQIVLHHTAGGPRPDFTIGWWQQDAQRVATSFVIGRAATDGEKQFDGAVYRAFPEYLWAYHLGLSSKNSNISAELRTGLNKISIGIEICSYGPLIKKSDGTYRTVVNNKIIPPEDVCDLGEEWRGYQYFQKYTDKQLEACREIVLSMAWYFNIPVEDIHYDASWFGINQNALNGLPGIWTHVNYRKDKTDCFPQPELIEMLNGLHEENKTFVPSLEVVEVSTPRDLDFAEEDVKEYAFDLDEG